MHTDAQPALALARGLCGQAELIMPISGHDPKRSLSCHRKLIQSSAGSWGKACAGDKKILPPSSFLSRVAKICKRKRDCKTDSAGTAIQKTAESGREPGPFPKPGWWLWGQAPASSSFA